MKKFLFAVLCAAALSSCGKIEDTPEIIIETESYEVSSAGGELNIKLSTPGIDDVDIDYPNNNEWVYDKEEDAYVPANGWIEIISFTNNDNSTRALPLYNSGIKLNILPNDSGYERKAYIEVISFNLHKTITIIQSAN